MDFDKWIAWIGIMVAIILILKYECDKGSACSKYIVKYPYSYTTLDKDKYGLSDDAIIYVAFAPIDKKYYDEKYVCEEIKQHAFAKIQNTFRDITAKIKNGGKVVSPLNTVLNALSSASKYTVVGASGVLDKTYYIRYVRGDISEVFSNGTNIYIS